tara:strand:- start:533 stop:658 length:126 start_codon:yes stop_codon:yes gene_type:complete
LDWGGFEHGEIVRSKLLVTCSDATEVFDVIEKMIDPVALFV